MRGGGAGIRAGGVAPRDGYKRAFDLTALAVAFVLLAPLWLPVAVALALAIRLVDGGPVIYRQRRLGRYGRSFAMLKFRTMPVSAEAVTGPVWAGEPDARATPLGRVLRRLRLDELPQVVNVLRGDMSLVGPRPERPELVGCCERQAPGFARRLAVLPGIAGLAQARLGSAATPAEKLRCDLVYIRAMGPWLDARLFAASLVRLVREAVAPVAAPVRGHGGSCRIGIEGRYLRYDDAAATAEGLNHQRRNLECLLAEAHATGRLALPPPLGLSAAHNLGVARRWRWETYFDLAASALVDAAGRELPLPLACGAVPATAAHRHDQSIFSLLCMRHGVALVREKPFFTGMSWGALARASARRPRDIAMHFPGLRATAALVRRAAERRPDYGQAARAARMGGKAL